jgi:hypothetical protein
MRKGLAMRLIAAEKSGKVSHLSARLYLRYLWQWLLSFVNPSVVDCRTDPSMAWADQL